MELTFSGSSYRDQDLLKQKWDNYKVRDSKRMKITLETWGFKKNHRKPVGLAGLALKNKDLFIFNGRTDIQKRVIQRSSI